MATFAYSGRTRAGQAISGEHIAETMEAAVAALRRDQVLVTRINPVKEKAAKGAKGFKAKAVPAKNLAVFTRQFSVMLDAGLRSRIVYQTLNLAHGPFSLPFTEFDLILLRNVLIYFRRPLQRRVVLQVAPLLAPEGVLFLGATETLWQIQEELEAVDLGPCFAYRHRREAPAVEKPAPVRPVEFDIPKHATEKGALELTWTREAGLGGNGRGNAVSEIWLIRK